MRQLKRSTTFFRILATLGIFYLSLFLTLSLWYGNTLPHAELRAHYLFFTPLFGLWIFFCFITALFDPYSLRTKTTAVFGVVQAMTINTLVGVVYFYAQPSLVLTPRRFLLVLVLIASVVMIGFQLLLIWWFRAWLGERVYFFSKHPGFDELVKEVQAFTGLGLHYAGTLERTTHIISERNTSISVVIPAAEQLAAEDIAWLYQLRSSGVHFLNYRDFYEHLLRKVYVSEVDQLWFVQNVIHKRRGYEVVKRLVDIVMGLVGSIVFVVTFPLIAFLIKLTSSGSILYKQERIGKHGKPFTLLKYRTMQQGSGGTWTEFRDTRITPLGKWLRKLRLDELPQSINILKGDMSVIGPRPEQTQIVDQLAALIPFYHERHTVKPGLTGWAQLHVYAASVEESKQKLQFDLYYVKHQSFLFDIEIMLRTLYVLLTGRGR